MTREELADFVSYARRMLAFPGHAVAWKKGVVQLADERDAAVRILSAPPDTVARVEGETKDETIERLHRVIHERNNAWAWERRERERAEAAEAGWKAQRDAALADVETLKREILAVARQAADLNKTTEEQRDRALALLREDRNGARERDGKGWSDRRRALLAEVDWEPGKAGT